MSDTSIENVRAKIDAIDTQIHDLLMARADVVAPLAALKARDGVRDHIRPAREAEILRRLIARHRGPLPAETVLSLWRALMAAQLRLQGAFSVHVYGGEEERSFWDLARAYYGTGTPMTAHPAIPRLLQAVRDVPGALGVVPVPGPGEEQPMAWWQGLHTEASPWIVSRLPFLVTPDGAALGEVARPPAYAVACTEPTPTGDDRTVLAVTTAPAVSTAWVQSRLDSLGLQSRLVSTAMADAEPPQRSYLCEVQGFLVGERDRFADLVAHPESGIKAVETVGAFAVPLVVQGP